MIKNLEELLKLYGCKRPFKNNGKLSVEGYKAYNKLLATLEGIEYITGRIPNVADIVNELDKIEYEV